MIELNPNQDLIHELFPHTAPLSFHQTFYSVYEKLKKWLARFPFAVDDSIFNDLFLFYLLATKKFLDHRNATHAFRMILTIHLMQKNLLRAATVFHSSRHINIRWIPTQLVFPFASKPVLGCLIGFNVRDRYELFDEENVLLALEKHHPELRFMKESSYCHTSQNKNLKIFYFEIEKKDISGFSLAERNMLKNNLEDKIKNSIQTLSPTVYMGLNEEEIYKNILILSQEIDSLHDLPQAYITLDQQTGKEIIFRVVLVYLTPFNQFPLKERFEHCTFTTERILPVRHLKQHPIEAHIFRLALPRDSSFLRSDGSLDFYSARQEIVGHINAAIGEFRDFNGGIIIKQQELLDGFKEHFPEIAENDPESIESFFYSISPLEKQVVLPLEALSTLFQYHLDNRQGKLQKDPPYSVKLYQEEYQAFLTIRAENTSIKEIISSVLQAKEFTTWNMAYNLLQTSEGIFCNCVLLEPDADRAESLMHTLEDSLNAWYQQVKNEQILRIGLETVILSLDPRIGGEENSGSVLRLLFEGLTRFNQNGEIENGITEFIEVSSDLRHYVFKLRPSLWNNGSPLTAYDFEYSWKKTLSPDFNTVFATLFYPIKNAKEAKDGKVPLDEVGVKAIDHLTLKVELAFPAPYFLQLTAHPLFSPIHRLIDQQHPQWPYQAEKNYPCNGPFQLRINQPNQGYKLIKNPLYWDRKHIGWDQVILTQVTAVQAYQAFQKNELDWIGNPFGSWYSFYTPRKEDQIISLPNGLVMWNVFNNSCAPFNHPKLRQAFAYAIERSELIADSSLPLTPAFSALIPRLYGKSRRLFPEYNKEKARTLLKEALDELGLAHEALNSLELIYCQHGIREYTAQQLKQQIKDCLGIECRLNPLPGATYYNRMSEGAYQIGIWQWASRVDDASYTLNAFRNSKEALNFAKWEHPEFEHLLNLSEQELNPLQRSAYLLRTEEILSQEMPIIPLFYQPYQALTRKHFQVNYRTPCVPFDFARGLYNKETSHVSDSK